jgi:hypothetical protein
MMLLTACAHLIIGTAICGGLVEGTKRKIHIASLALQSEKMPVGAKWMINGINSNPALLPGYELIMEHYYIGGSSFSPGVVGSSDVSKAAGVRFGDALSNIDKKYVAVFGPDTNEDAVEAILHMMQSFRMVNIHGSVSPELSDRTKYPYMFRNVVSFLGSLSLWYYISSACGWKRAVATFNTEGVEEAAFLLGQALGVETYPDIMPTASRDMPDFDPALFWDRDWEQKIVKRIRTKRTRVVFAVPTSTYLMTNLVCYVIKNDLGGIQYFLEPGQGWGFHVDELAISAVTGGKCSSSEVAVAARGWITAFDGQVPSGITAYHVDENGQDLSRIVQNVPPIVGNMADNPLTCDPRFTSSDVFNNYDLIKEAVDNGEMTSWDLIQVWWSTFPWYPDAVCALSLALHDTIYNKGITVDELESRTPKAYAAFNDALQNASFDGVRGAFKFRPGSGDLISNYFLVFQQALPEDWTGYGPNVAHIVGACTYPDGNYFAPPALFFLAKPMYFRDGSAIGSGGFVPPDGTAKLGIYPECAPKNAELKNTSCVLCAAGRRFDPLLGDSGACRSCGPGFYQSEAGQSICLMCGEGYYAGENAANCTACPAGSMCGSAAGAPVACMAGYFAGQLASTECEICPMATYAAGEGNSACSNCTAGKVTPFMGARGPEACNDPPPCPEGQFATIQGCEYCPLGRFRDLASVTTPCSPCQPGSMCERGIAKLCAKGTYNQQAGSSACETCSMSSYANDVGMTECLRCLANQETQLGAIHPDNCTCLDGFFKNRKTSDPATGICSPCPDGMVCEEGSDMRNWPDGPGEFPKAHRGKMTLATKNSDPLFVYICLPASACLGGGPDSCARNRDPESIACGQCSKDAYESDGECLKCGDETVFDIVWPIVLGAVAAITGLCIVTVAINGNLLMQTSSSMLGVVVIGMLVTGIQTLGVFSSLEIDWEDPLKGIFELMSVMNIDLKLLKGQCIYGVSPVTNFACRQMVCPAGFPFAFLVLLVKKYKLPETPLRMQFTNTCGTVMNLFFISVVVSAVNPFMCYKHVGDLMSMRSSPSILCYQGGEHNSMLIVSLIALLMVPIPFLTFACIITKKYPAYLHSELQRRRVRLQAMRFLFFRFCPDRYYHGLIMLVRSLCIALVPAIFLESSLQIGVMALVLGVYLIIQQQLAPWRIEPSNIIEGVIVMSLLLILVSGALLTDTSTAKQKENVAFIGVVATAGFFLTLLGCLAWAAYTKFGPMGKFKYFICHHKADAAGQARFIQLLLADKTKQDIFIDSDDLKELDQLFDIVKTKVEILCVYLTRDTLTRPWCAGEVTVSRLSGKVQIVMVYTPFFLAPTEDHLNDLSTYIDQKGCSLEVYGISNSDIADAFRTVLSNDYASQFQFDRSVPGTQRFTDLIRCLVGGRCESETSVVSPKVPGLLISADAFDDEAIAAAGTLYRKIAEEFQRICAGEICCLADFSLGVDFDIRAGDLHAIVVILSARSLEVQAQLNVIVMGQKYFEAGVIPTNCPAFNFPTDDYYAEILPRMWQGCSDCLDAGEAEGHIKAFFKRISAPLSMHASDAILNTQSQEILGRIPRTPTKSTRRTGNEMPTWAFSDLNAREFRRPSFTPTHLQSRGEDDAEQVEYTVI